MSETETPEIEESSSTTPTPTIEIDNSHPFDDQFSNDLLKERQELFQIFDDLKIEYGTHWHPVANTVDELLEAVKDVDGIVCKNLFTKAKKKGLLFV